MMGQIGVSRPQKIPLYTAIYTGLISTGVFALRTESAPVLICKGVGSGTWTITCLTPTAHQFPPPVAVVAAHASQARDKLPYQAGSIAPSLLSGTPDVRGCTLSLYNPSPFFTFHRWRNLEA